MAIGKAAGGAIAVSDQAKVNISFSTFRRNQAEIGGAVASQALATLNTTGCVVVENWANQAGGLAIGGSTQLQLTDSFLDSNVAGTSGGGVAVMEVAHASLFNVTIVNNTVAQLGQETACGGVMVGMQASLNMVSCHVTRNNGGMGMEVWA